MTNRGDEPIVQVSSNDLSYPLVRFYKVFFNIMKNDDDLCGYWSRASIRDKDRDKILLVDKELSVYQIASARVLHGAGPLWGFRLFGGRVVKVELLLTRRLHGITLEEVKQKMRSSFKNWHGWQSDREYYSSTRKIVQTSESMAELLARLAELNAAEKYDA